MLGRVAVSTSGPMTTRRARATCEPRPAATLCAEVLRAGRSTRCRFSWPRLTRCVETVLATSDLDVANVVHRDRGLSAPTNIHIGTASLSNRERPTAYGESSPAQTVVRLEPDSCSREERIDDR